MVQGLTDTENTLFWKQENSVLVSRVSRNGQVWTNHQCLCPLTLVHPKKNLMALKLRLIRSCKQW